MEFTLATILAIVGLTEIYILIYLVATPRQHSRARTLRKLERLNVFLAFFFVITLGTFLSMNGQAYAENVTFGLKNIFGGGSEQAPTDTIFNLPATVSAQTPSGPMELIIPKTGVRTPIVIPTDTSTEGVLKSLEDGVGLYPGSVMPGQKGHAIILGHSSRASWYNGDYARVFALLNQLEVGDEFMIVSGDTKYVYKIFSNQVFKPAAADVYLAGPAAGSVVDLVTCDPVGSASNRRIVSAALQGTGQ